MRDRGIFNYVSPYPYPRAVQPRYYASDSQCFSFTSLKLFKVPPEVAGDDIITSYFCTGGPDMMCETPE